LKGLAAIASLDRTAFEEARGHLETALSVDPHFAMAAAWLARWHMLRAGQGWSPDFAQDVDEAELYARRALAVEPRNALALATRGHVLSFLRHEAGEGLAWLDRARAACPNSHVAWQLCSAAHSYLGEGECAIAQAERGLRLSPQDRWLFHGTFFLGLAHYAAGQVEEALRWLRLSRSENPLYTANLRLLAATHVALGQTDAARAVVGDLLRREPGFTLSGYAAQRQPFQDPALREGLLAALGAAGVPD
jgi:adenylate cyclase